MITLPEEQFRRAAKFASSVVNRRHTIPVLATIKVKANGALSFEGTDLDTYVRATVPYSGDEAEFLINEPRAVSAAIRASGGETVALTPMEKTLHVKAGDLVADLSSHIPPDDFPVSELVVEEVFGATVGNDFFAALDRVRPAISLEETRYYLNGVHVRKVGDWLYRLTATDGHRLFMADVPLPDATGELGDIIIPRRAVERAIAAFGKSSEGVRFALGFTAKTNRRDATLAPNGPKPRVGFSCELGELGMELSSKLIDGTFPDVDRVIPAEHSFAIRANREALAKAIKSLTPLSTDRTRAIKITTEPGQVRIELNSPEIGKSAFTVPAEHSAPADFYIGLNARYLLEAFRSLKGDEVEFGLNDPGSPMTIRDPSDTAFKIVQMPMRV